MQVTAGTYAGGTPLNAGWFVALALVAFWVDSPAPLDRSSAQEARPASGATALIVPAVATAAGWGYWS